jgi:hypothetical protein
MSIKKAYKSEDLVIWKKMTSIPKGLRFMLVRTRAVFCVPFLYPTFDEFRTLNITLHDTPSIKS